MMLDSHTFHQIWNGEDTIDLFEFEEQLPEPSPPNICEPAQAFLDWADRTLVFNEHSDMVTINQAKVMLLERYMSWLGDVSKRHKYHLSERGHTCIFQIFVRVYSRIKTVEYKVLPPLILPPKPPPPPKPEVLILGEEI